MPDKPHEFVGEIGVAQTRADMHMEAAETHLLEYVYLSAQFVGLKVTVPRPERGASVFARGAFKKLVGERRSGILLVKHQFSSLIGCL